MLRYEHRKRVKKKRKGIYAYCETLQAMPKKKQQTLKQCRIKEVASKALRSLFFKSSRRDPSRHPSMQNAHRSRRHRSFFYSPPSPSESSPNASITRALTFDLSLSMASVWQPTAASTRFSASLTIFVISSRSCAFSLPAAVMPL